MGPKHLAFRLDNGSVCRIAYSAALKSTSSKLPEDVNKEKGKTGKYIKFSVIESAFLALAYS